MTKDFNEKIGYVQSEIKAPKNLKNESMGYTYRSAEDILEIAKPIIHKWGLTLSITDEVIYIGNRYYVKATATLTNGEDSISTTAYARETEERKGLDQAQLTGAASSYARKYALNGLFLLDDNKDIDSMNNTDTAPQKDNATLFKEFCSSIKGQVNQEELKKFWNYYSPKMVSWHNQVNPKSLWEKWISRATS